MSAILTVAELADLIGEDATGELAREFAGTSLCLPTDHEQEPRLEKAIGALAASCLCEEMAGRTAEFPAVRRAQPPAHTCKAKPTVSTGKGSVRPSATTKTGSRVLDDIAEVIGFEAALKIAREFTGERLYIPLEPENQPRIAKAIGKKLAATLCAALWRTTVTIPVRQAREMRVIELSLTGCIRQEIARKLYITERQVYRVLRAYNIRRQEELPR